MTKTEPQMPPPDFLALAIRSYLDHGNRRTRQDDLHISSDCALIFDCETTTDAAQSLRFGAFQWREGGDLRAHGLFYDPAGLDEMELELLKEYATKQNHSLLTASEFINQFFYGQAYDLGARIVGFNLPFDISRLAKEHGPARKSMKGGFTFRLSTDKRRPNVTVKHINSRMALIRFVTPFRQRTPRGMRKRGQKCPYESGVFVDVRTLAAALLSRSHSLSSLSKHLKVSNPKLETEDHGGPLTGRYLDYAIRDVQSTWECFEVLERQYLGLGLNAPINRIMSEASIGKTYLATMGIRPWREVQPDFPPALLGNILSAYYGGRSEVRIRRKITRVVYCDFLSMYPTVCTKMGLWKFVTAKGMRWRNARREIRDFLADVTAEDFRRTETWHRLKAIVRLRPTADLLPVRADYTLNAGTSIGLNYLTSKQPLYYTLADCIAAKLLTGKIPEIDEAIVFEAGPPQLGLKPVNVGGKEECRVDPTKDDFYKQLIELRQSIKAESESVSADRCAQLDAAQMALKIAANATSYGIFVEVNVRDGKRQKQSSCFGPRRPFKVLTSKIEQPGRYFHPLLATLITGAARLLLALVENRTNILGLDWAFCDTDSMAIARPESMDEQVFRGEVTNICQWFNEMNPYKQKGPLLKIENDNYTINGSKDIAELFCLAVSAKRYALFNLENGSPIIRKVSSHGLGHLLEPYGEANPAQHIPLPQVSLKDARLWHHDFWFQIVTAELQQRGAEVDQDWHDTLNLPAKSQYRASSPELLRWFNTYNNGKDYRETIKPYNFLLTLLANRRSGRSSIKPVAPYDSNHGKAVLRAFDRITGAPINPKGLLSYKEALAQYHLHPESKFHNADYCDTGHTSRRHVIAIGIRHIGKESDRWEESMHCYVNDETEIEYGAQKPVADHELADLRKFAVNQSVAEIARVAGLSERHVANTLKGRTRPSGRAMRLLRGAAECVRAVSAQQAQVVRDNLRNLQEVVARDGLRATAKAMGVDASNLRRKLLKKGSFGYSDRK